MCIFKSTIKLHSICPQSLGFRLLVTQYWEILILLNIAPLSTLQVDNPSCFVGLILENCDLPYANHGHVILGDPSPILFYPISSTEIRCLVDVPGQKVPSISNGEMAQYLKSVVAPQVSIIFLAWFLYIYPGTTRLEKSFLC